MDHMMSLDLTKTKFSGILFGMRSILIIFSNALLCLPLYLFIGLKIMQSTPYIDASSGLFCTYPNNIIRALQLMIRIIQSNAIWLTINLYQKIHPKWLWIFQYMNESLQFHVITWYEWIRQFTNSHERNCKVI